MTAPTCEARYHGTASAYRRHHCRCANARAAKRLDDKLRKVGLARPRLIDSTGTRRRIEALLALGWPFKTIARELGYSPSSVPWRLVTQPTVHVRTAERVRAVYDRLSMTPGPNAETKRRARRAGYVPPLSWDDESIDDPTATPDLTGIPVLVDEVAVERALNGELDRPLTRPEFQAAIERGARRMRLGDPDLAALLGCSNETIRKTRIRLEIPAIDRWEAHAC